MRGCGGFSRGQALADDAADDATAADDVDDDSDKKDGAKKKRCAAVLHATPPPRCTAIVPSPVSRKSPRVMLHHGASAPPFQNVLAMPRWGAKLKGFGKKIQMRMGKKAAPDAAAKSKAPDSAGLPGGKSVVDDLSNEERLEILMQVRITPFCGLSRVQFCIHVCC